MTTYDTALDHIGGWLARRLSAKPTVEIPYVPADMRVVAACLKPGDVILCEGHSMVATAIKYLTQSSWAHAAMYVGDALGGEPGDPNSHCLVESNLGRGLCERAAVEVRTREPARLSPDRAHR